MTGVVGGGDGTETGTLLFMCYLMNKLQIELRDQSAGVAPGGRSGSVGVALLRLCEDSG